MPGGTIFTVRYGLGCSRSMPIHWQGQREASILEGRLGIIVLREETPEWMQIYRCLVGRHDIRLGRGWILVRDIPEALSEPVLAPVELDAPAPHQD